MQITFMFLLAVIVGSMIGAGIIVKPGEIMIYGFSGILGWCLASFCSIILGNIFASNSVSNPDKQESPSQACASTYGPIFGFIIGITQWLYVTLASCVIMLNFVKYGVEFIKSSFKLAQQIFALEVSNRFDFLDNIPNIEKCLISCFIIGVLLWLHGRTDKAKRLLFFLTWFKIVFFGIIAVLGLITFNYAKILGVVEGTNLFQSLRLGFANVRIGNVLTASTIALFAFAGLESGSAKPSEVYKPKQTIPEATRWAIAISSFIFISIHILCVNVLDPNRDFSAPNATPLKDAMEIIAAKYVSVSFVPFIGTLISFIAFISCFGTVLALLSVAPKILEDSRSIINPDYKASRTRTGFPRLESNLTFIFSIAILLFTPARVFEIIPYLIATTYTSPILVSIKRSGRNMKKLFMNLTGLVACIVLLMGCEVDKMLVGALLQMVIGLIAMILKSNDYEQNIQNN